jgi:hypothetical protein
MCFMIHLSPARDIIGVDDGLLGLDAVWCSLVVMGWDWRHRTAASTGLLFIPGWYAMWTMVWWYWRGLTPNLSTRALWHHPVLSGGPVSRDISVAAPRTGWFPASRNRQRHLAAASTVWLHDIRDASGASGRWAKEMRIYSIRPRGTPIDLLTAVKSYDMGPPASLPLRSKVCCGILSPLKIHRLGRARTRNLLSLVASTLTTTPPRWRCRWVPTSGRRHCLHLQPWRWR